MHADARKLLWDAREAARRVLRFTQGRNFADYRADDMLRSAVERQLEIIGEALGGLRRVDPDTAAAITDLGTIVAFRNILAHGYASIDDRIVWGVIEVNLMPLIDALDALLAQPD